MADVFEVLGADHAQVKSMLSALATGLRPAQAYRLIVLPLGLLEFQLRLFQLAVYQADRIDRCLFILPLRFQMGGFLFQIRQIPFQPLQTFS